jgi:hypothetical protein
MKRFIEAMVLTVALVIVAKPQVFSTSISAAKNIAYMVQGGMKSNDTKTLNSGPTVELKAKVQVEARALE